MSSLNNEGYGIPLNYVFDYNKIYFHYAVEGSKLDYLRTNNKASFSVVGNTQILPSKFGTLYKSAIVSGSVREVEGIESSSKIELLKENLNTRLY